MKLISDEIQKKLERQAEKVAWSCVFSDPIRFDDRDKDYLDIICDANYSDDGLPYATWEEFENMDSIGLESLIEEYRVIILESLEFTYKNIFLK